MKTFKCPFNDGDNISCVIKGQYIDHGMIHYEKGNLYILNNKADGQDAKNLRGFKYSWLVCVKGVEACDTWKKGTRENNVSDIAFISHNLTASPFPTDDNDDFIEVTVKESIPAKLNGFKNPMIPKGYRTWIPKNNTGEVITLEGNRWGTNFPRKYFDFEDEFKTITHHQYKIGDRVSIVDRGKIYPTWDEAFTGMGFRNKDSNKYIDDINTGKVFNIAMHPDRDGEVLLGINLDNERQCLIGIIGVSMIKPSYEFKEHDLVIVTEYHGKKEWSHHWFKHGEIIQIGGTSYNDERLEGINSFNELCAKSKENPDGNGMSNQSRYGGFTMRHVTEKEREYFGKIGLGANINDMNKKKVYKFNKGDLVIVTEWQGKKDWKIHWFKPGEILKLGGEYWLDSKLEKYNDGDEFDAICADRPTGNGMVKQKSRGGFILRHVNADERAYYQRKGLGANINDMKFFKDDYIVSLIDYDTKSFIKYHCYKQRTTWDYLKPYEDSVGDTGNGWGVIGFNKPGNWRYATSVEIQRYREIGKPFNTLKIENPAVDISMKGKIGVGSSNLFDKAVKVKTLTVRENELVQEELFKLGYSWTIAGKTLINTDAIALWAYTNGKLSCSHSLESFNASTAYNMSIEEFIKPGKIKSLLPEPHEKSVASMRKTFPIAKRKKSINF